jgi:hypothetical protein
VYCKARFFGGINRNWDLPDFNLDDFLFDNCIFCSALFRKSDFLKVGGYKPYMVYGLEDYELWMSFIELGLKPYRIDRILFNYRRKHQMSRTDKLVSSSKLRDMKKEIITHHLQLYLNNESFVKYITELCPRYPKYIEKLLNENLKKTKKIKKYKKLLLVSYFIFGCLLAVMCFLLKNTNC